MCACTRSSIYNFRRSNKCAGSLIEVKASGLAHKLTLENYKYCYSSRFKLDVISDFIFRAKLQNHRPAISFFAVLRYTSRKVFKKILHFFHCTICY